MEGSDTQRKSLVQRLAVAAVGIPLVVGAVLIGRWVFAGLVAVVAGIAAWEYGRLMQRRGVLPQWSLLVGGAVAQNLLTFAFGSPLVALGVVGLSIVLLAWGMALWWWRGSPLLNTAATVAGVCYVGGLLSAVIPLQWVKGGIEVPGGMVLPLLAAVWVGDTAAYAVGRRWGRYPLAPRVSPKKTWEGTVACFIGTALAFWGLLQWWMPVFPGGEALALGVLLGVVGQVGDLAESQLKRDVAVKDSSALLPGHGGMLDRIDSLLFAAPCLYAWLALRGWIG